MASAWGDSWGLSWGNSWGGGTTSGGHFMPGLAGVRAGKRKTNKEVFEEVAEIVEQAIEEIVPKKTLRVSRRRKSNIIDRVTAELSRQGVLIGEVQALDRAASLLSKVALKRRREAQQAARIESQELQRGAEIVDFSNVIDARAQEVSERQRQDLIREEDEVIEVLLMSIVNRMF